MAQRSPLIRRPPAGGAALIVTAALGMVAGVAYDGGLNTIAYAVAAIAIAWLIWLLLWQMMKSGRER